jgi:hypothetical protein
VGSALTAIAWFTGPVWHGFAMQRDGTVLLFLTIPLLIFGAHCLDLMDKQEEEVTQARFNSFRQESRKKGNENDLGRD